MPSKHPREVNWLQMTRFNSPYVCVCCAESAVASSGGAVLEGHAQGVSESHALHFLCHILFFTVLMRMVEC
jgi:hypothetical protein